MCVRDTSISVREISTFESTNYEDIGREWNKRDVFGERLVELFTTNFHATKDTTGNSWKIGIFKDKSMFSSGVYSRSFMIRDSREKHILDEINRIVWKNREVPCENHVHVSNFMRINEITRCGKRPCF